MRSLWRHGLSLHLWDGAVNTYRITASVDVRANTEQEARALVSALDHDLSVEDVTLVSVEMIHAHRRTAWEEQG